MTKREVSMCEMGCELSFFDKNISYEEVFFEKKPPKKINTPLDPTALNILFELQDEDNPNLLIELINSFFCETETKLKAMREAFETNNQERLELLAHTLKSNTASLGAWQMELLCIELELISSKGLTNEVENLINQLENEFVVVREALEMEQNKLKLNNN